MPINIQSPGGFDPIGAASRGLALREQLQGAPARKEARGLELQGARDTARLQSVVQGAQQLKAISSPQGKIDFLNQRRQQLQTAGLPSNDTDEALQLAQSGRFDELEAVTDRAISAGQQGRAQRVAPQQRGETRTVRNNEGGLISVTDVFNPNTGQIEQVASPIDGSLVSRFTGETGVETRAGRTQQAINTKAGVLGEQIKAEPELVRQKELAKGGAALTNKTIDDSFSAIQAIEGNSRNIDRAISALDRGAGTGAVERFFPSIKAASVELDQIQNELGLDVVRQTTFGALSAGELRLALRTALPNNLDEGPLRKWLVDKKAAQQKLAGYYSEVVNFLDGGGTVPEFLQSRQKDQAASEIDPALLEFMSPEDRKLFNAP